MGHGDGAEYQISYDPRVADDIASLPRPTRERLKRAIEKKLAGTPEYFGKPLRHSLHGARSLRVGDYRVIYTIGKHDVTVVLIAHRKSVYETALKRLGMK